MSGRPIFHCLFCGRPENEAMMLITGPNTVMICEECVLLSVGMIIRKWPDSSYADRVTEEIAQSKRDAAMATIKQSSNEYSEKEK